MRRAGRTPGRSPVGSVVVGPADGPHPDHGPCLGRAGPRSRGTGDRRAPRSTSRTRRLGRPPPRSRSHGAVVPRAGGHELARRGSGTRARAPSMLRWPRREARLPARLVAACAGGRRAGRASVPPSSGGPGQRTQRHPGLRDRTTTRWPRRVPRPRSALADGPRFHCVRLCRCVIRWMCTSGGAAMRRSRVTATWMTASLCFPGPSAARRADSWLRAAGQANRTAAHARWSQVSSPVWFT